MIYGRFRINETRQTGAVSKPHLPGDESVYLFFEFTIVIYIALNITDIGVYLINSLVVRVQYSTYPPKIQALKNFRTIGVYV